MLPWSHLKWSIKTHHFDLRRYTRCFINLWLRLQFLTRFYGRLWETIITESNQSNRTSLAPQARHGGNCPRPLPNCGGLRFYVCWKMNVVPAGGERRIAVKTGGGETLLVIRAGVYTSLFWFVGVGNACVFTSGSPVEKATVIFCEACQTLEMKRALTTAAEAVFDSAKLKGNLLLAVGLTLPVTRCVFANGPSRQIQICCNQTI